MRFHRLRTGALMGLVITACGPAPAPAGEEPETTPRREALTVTDSLALETIAPAEVRAGEPVLVTLRVRNVSSRALHLGLTGRTIVFDIVITDSAGRDVWRRLADQVIQPILRADRLEPGASLELADRWDQRDAGGRPVGPGEYTVMGVLPTDAAPLRTPGVRLRIVG